MKRYPMLSNWVSIKDYRFGNVTITNEMTEKVYRIDQTYLPFLEMLDGKTDPYTLPYAYLMGWQPFEIKDMLTEFSTFGIVRENMYLKKSITSLYRTVFIPSRRRSDSVLFKLINAFMRLFFIPIFIYGIIAFWSDLTTVGFEEINQWGIFGGMLMGYLLGGAFHESGHIVASLATRGEVYEVGVNLRYLIFPGAYALTKEHNSSTQIQKAQVYAAGMEANLILVGIALMIVPYFHQGASFLVSFALVNLLLVFDNLLFIRGIDGCWIYSYIFGLDTCITDVALNMILTKEKRKRLLANGCCGKASFCTYSLIILLYAAGVAFILLSFVFLITTIIK